MKVIHIQTHLPTSGNVAYRLHKAFLENGIESSMLSKTSDRSGEENIYTLGGFVNKILDSIDQKITSKLLKIHKKYGSFSYHLFGHNIAKLPFVKNVDFIYLHWINGNFLSLKNIRQLSKLNKPIIIFMHDMWTITGGCHYSFECDKYQTKCTSCQMFIKPKENDLSTRIFEKKLKLYSELTNLYFVAPSKWLYNCIKLSALTNKKPVFHIPNVIEHRFFKPFDKKIAKQILNIDPDSTAICFGASSVDNPYKGWNYLVEALVKLKSEIADRKITVLVFGNGNYDNLKSTLPFDINFVGRLNDDYSTILLYNAADIFLLPSLADNLPTTVMESLSCGTPVVGFNIGGIPDMIDHEKNGYLAEYKNTNELVKGINYCLDNDIKGYLLPEFEKKLLLEKHLSLFENIKNTQYYLQD